jgi:hypothetical protein
MRSKRERDSPIAASSFAAPWKLAGLGGVAGRDEQLRDARLHQAREHLREVGAVADKPRRQVRHDKVARRREPLTQLERRVEPLARRRRDGDLRVGRQVLGDLLLDAVEREQLKAGAAKLISEACGASALHHCDISGSDALGRRSAEERQGEERQTAPEGGQLDSQRSQAGAA